MTYAQTAANLINTYCRVTFNDMAMASGAVAGTMIDAFDVTDSGSHKYIPADRLSADLGAKPGSGVYGYWKMSDGSYVLQTCEGPLAWWDGQDDHKAMQS